MDWESWRWCSRFYVLATSYVVRREPQFVEDPRRVAMICGLVLAALVLIRLLSAQTWNAEIVPVAIVGMIVAIAYSPGFAMMVTFGLSLLTCITLGTQIPYFLVVMGGTAAGVLTLSEVRTRTKLIKVGATAAATYFLLTWATGLWQDQPLAMVRDDSLWRAGWGLMAGFLLGGSLPFIENALGIVTGISLLELGDNTHPLLQELVRRRPAPTTIRSPSARSRKPPQNASAPTACSCASGLTFMTSARCSNPTTLSKTRSGRPIVMPSWPPR